MPTHFDAVVEKPAEIGSPVSIAVREIGFAKAAENDTTSQEMKGQINAIDAMIGITDRSI